MPLIFKSYKTVKVKKQAGSRNSGLTAYKKKMILVGVSGFIVIIILISFFMWGKTHFKDTKSLVTEVVLLGDLHHLDRDVLYGMVKSEVENGFFSLNVNKIKKHLLSQAPWAEKVIVRRAWPRRLIIKVQEHNAQAIWNYQGIINEFGALIRPDLKNFHEVLPVLIGPEDKLEVVWKQLIDYDAILASTGRKVMRLELAQRGAWRLRLDNGMQVILGTHDKNQRLHRFVQAYHQSLKYDQAAIAYVDMRYTTGMAVGWKAL